MAEESQSDRDKRMAASRLLSIADLSNMNTMLAYHLREASKAVGEEKSMSNSQNRAYIRLASL